MRRRGVGIGAIQKSQQMGQKFKEKGTELAEDQLKQLSQQMVNFKDHLETFARKHRHEIKKNPHFRAQFQKMCSQTGVDPLASSKGFWSEMLGIGDFYYELAVQAIEVCAATRAANGGIITLEDLHKLVTKSRSTKVQETSIDDLQRALKKLRLLGGGFTVIPIGHTHLVQSVPGELSMDHTTVLQQAQETGYTSKSILVTVLQWQTVRATSVLDFMVREGLAWVDKGSGTSECLYWFPSMVNSFVEYFKLV